ncbi:MAG TPA: element excision factor XisH family protein [Candidatus Obscuribacterales bacterium]
MAAKDIYHNVVKIALEKDGWKITDDPLRLTIGSRSVYVDLGAEKLFAAEKEGRKIAVEVKSFVNPSPVNDLENALGQYILYAKILEEEQPERVIYLAIPLNVFEDIFSEPIGQILLRKTDLRLLVFDPKKEVIVQWTS